MGNPRRFSDAALNQGPGDKSVLLGSYKDQAKQWITKDTANSAFIQWLAAMIYATICGSQHGMEVQQFFVASCIERLDSSSCRSHPPSSFLQAFLLSGLINRNDVGAKIVELML